MSFVKILGYMSMGHETFHCKSKQTEHILTTANRPNFYVAYVAYFIILIKP